MSVSVYTVANERFFPGLAGLVSSLRVNGHVGPIVVVDSGLTRKQVRTLSNEITVIDPPRDLPSYYLKPCGPLETPDDVMLFIDADMLCVRPLDEIVANARRGAIVVFEDIGRPGYSGATWREWEERLHLGQLKPTTYVNSGFFALPRDLGRAFFTKLEECLDLVDPSETLIDSRDLDFELPFFFPDQDVANAILASSPFRTETMILPYARAPHAPFPGVRLAGDGSCIDGRGERPNFLHHALQKPWLEPLPSNPYTELLV